MFKSGFLSFIYPHKSELSYSLQKTISLEIIFMKINNNLNLIIPKQEQIILNKKLFNYLISQFEILLNNFNLIKKGIIQINFLDKKTRNLFFQILTKTPEFYYISNNISFYYLFFLKYLPISYFV